MLAGDPVVLRDWKFGVLLVAVIGTMVLLYLNVGLSGANRTQLEQVTERQQLINQAIRVSQFSTQFIQGLARLTAETKDEDLRKLLADHGVTFTVAAEPKAAAAEPKAAAAKPEPRK